jgi:hypothetical protein
MNFFVVKNEKGARVVDFWFRSQPRSRIRTCAHVREHHPDLLARGTEATVMRDTLQEAA